MCGTPHGRLTDGPTLNHAGLCRFCTRPYKPPAASNLDDAYLHLTNHAVNRQNADGTYAAAPSAGGCDANKWTLLALRCRITEMVITSLLCTILTSWPRPWLGLAQHCAN